MTTTEKPTYTIEDIAEAVEQFAASLNAFFAQAHAFLDALMPETEETETAPAWPDAPLIRVKAATHCGDPIAIAPEGVLALRNLVASDYNAADGRILTEDTDEITDWKPVSLLAGGSTFADVERLVGSRLVDRYGNVWIVEPPTRSARKAVILLIDSIDSLRNHETEETEETEDAPGSVVGTWRKRPIAIEAAQLTGDTAHDLAVYQWIADNTLGPFEPLGVLEGRVPAPASGVSIDPSNSDLLIATLEGVMRARTGWWVIRGVEGEFYPCEPNIFATTYEKVD